MKFIVSKSGDEWRVRKTETDTDTGEVIYLHMSDTYCVVLNITTASMGVDGLYVQALVEGMRAIRCFIKSHQWRNDIGQM